MTLSTVSAVTPLTLLNTWANYGGAWGPAALFKDPHGVVHARGLISFPTNVTLGVVIANVPPGFLPIYAEMFIAPMQFGATANPQFARIDVGGSGLPSIRLADVSAGSGSIPYLSLSGITWLAGL